MGRDLYLTAKAHGGWVYVLPSVGFLGASLLIIQFNRPHIVHLYSIFEVLFPLAAATSIGSLPAAHFGAGMGEMESAFATSPLRRLVLALVPGVGLPVVSALLLAGWLDKAYLNVDPFSLIKAAAPPAAFLMSVAVLTASLARSSLAGLSAPALLWAFDAFTKGAIEHRGFLFPMRFPLRGVSGETLGKWQTQMHVDILLVSVVAVSAGIWLILRRHRWVR